MPRVRRRDPAAKQKPGARSPGRCRGASASSARAENGDIYIWLDPGVVAKLKALRGPGESYSDVIIRLVEAVR